MYNITNKVEHKDYIILNRKINPCNLVNNCPTLLWHRGEGREIAKRGGKLKMRTEDKIQ